MIIIMTTAINLRAVREFKPSWERRHSTVRCTST